MIKLDISIDITKTGEGSRMSCDILKREDATEKEYEIAKVLEGVFLDVLKNQKAIEVTETRILHDESTETWEKGD